MEHEKTEEALQVRSRTTCGDINMKEMKQEDGNDLGTTNKGA